MRLFQHWGQYDNLNRLLAVTTTTNGSGTAVFAARSSHNAANQRTSLTNADDSRWDYQYDALGQVTGGRKYWGDGTIVAGQQFEYGFDEIGNRTWAASGGDQWGANPRFQNYTVNSLNQYTQRTVPGSVDVLGSATNTATVTVNDRPTSRHGEYFRAELAFNNAVSAVYPTLTNLAVLPNGTNADLTVTNTGNLFLPQSPEAFQYDADGNLTNDGRWLFTWDGENRLVQMVANPSVPTAARLQLDFAYDHRGRRLTKKVSAWNGSGYVAQATNKFLHDGWNLLAELNQSNGVVRTYLWGADLSGSLQGAGGVGGLVAVNTATNGVHFAAYDGNGNIAVLVNATDGTISAQYEYGPFGETLRASGTAANANPFRFSTKYTDGETDLVYYGFRYYNPSTGRWASRDPIGERGGINLYNFVRNNPLSYIDPFGLDINQITGPVSLPADQCCAEKDKVTIHVVNRGSPVNQGGQVPGNPNTLQFTGGHIDLVIPGTPIGMVGFFVPTDGLGDFASAATVGKTGKLNVDLNDWTTGPTPRVDSLTPPQAVHTPNGNFQYPGVRSYICEIKVCPSQVQKMLQYIQQRQSDPGDFRMGFGGFTRNCSTMGCNILNSGGGGPNGGISGIDTPQDLQKQLKNAKCYYGFTFVPGATVTLAPNGTLNYSIPPGGQIQVVADPNQNHPSAPTGGSTRY